MKSAKSNAFSKKAQRTNDPPISWLMRTALSRPELISLAAGFTDSPSLPLHAIRSIITKLWEDKKTALTALQYGSTQGDSSLREWTARRIARMDGLREGVLPADQVVIGNGSQQLLSLITEILCDPGDILLIEDPTYFVYLGIVESCGLEAVPFSGAGQLRERLAQLQSDGRLNRVKMIYLVSYYRNPTGTSLTPEERKQISETIAHFEPGRPIYIVEDAAYRDLRFNGQDTPSFLALDSGLERTVYTATYTKPFATGLKVGYAILPKALVSSVLRFKGNEDFGTSHFDQQVLTRATRGGHYENHLQELAAVYREKASSMGEALKTHFPREAQWGLPDGGLYYWVHLPDGADCGMGSRLFEAALAADVLYVPGELCYCESGLRPKPKNQMRLSFGSSSVDHIREGIERLGRVLKKSL